MNIPEKQIEEILFKNQVVDKSTWHDILQEAQQLNLTPLDILFGRRLLDKNYFAQLLSDYLKVPLVDLRKTDIPASVLRLIPENVASEKEILPIELKDQVLKLAMVYPQDLETVSLVGNLTGLKIEPYLTLEEDFRYALTGYQKLYREKYNELIKKQLSEIDLATLTNEKTELSAVQIIDNLLGYAMGMNASDIHLEVTETFSLIRFRVDGVLREIMRLPKELHLPLVARVKILSNLQLDEHFKPQDGRFKTIVSNFPFDIRVSIMPTLYGEKVAMRLLAANFKPSSFEELGMPQANEVAIKESLNKAYGLILSTGPTGSGKTTTLYTVLQLLNRPEVNIVTIEDPIEYELAYINQSQVNQKIGFDFANGLRSFLRQDPNVIMVGEVRDFETADIAIQAALTGHLLLSTLHTNDAPSSIPRLIDLGVPNYLIAATVDIILAQRLVRKICLDCIISEKISVTQKEMINAQLKNLNLTETEIKNIGLPEFVYRGKGCVICSSSGYRGRIGIFETLKVDEEAKDYISQKNFHLVEFREMLKKKGFKTMFEDGLNKIFTGQTTLEEVMRVIRE